MKKRKNPSSFKLVLELYDLFLFFVEHFNWSKLWIAGSVRTFLMPYKSVIIMSYLVKTKEKWEKVAITGLEQ